MPVCQQENHWLDHRRRVLVMGDVILDRYLMGQADRISPEAPVVVVRCDSHEVRLGGAGAAAALLRGLRCSVTLAGVLGGDSSANTVNSLCANDAIESILEVDAARPTTLKERVIGHSASRSGQQIIRMDTESKVPIPDDVAKNLLKRILHELPNADAVLISDYGKGTCVCNLVRPVIQEAQRRGLPIIVDPPRQRDWSIYEGVEFLKCNRHEAELFCGASVETPQDALEAAHRICRALDIKCTVVTLDKDGCVARTPSDRFVFPSSRPKQICDITGAGDTFAAVLALGVISSSELSAVLPVCNDASGLQIERMGVSRVTVDEILRLSNPEVDQKRRLVTLKEAEVLASEYRRSGKRIVFTNGCFDLLHAGHVLCLEEAAASGDVLFLGLNSDESIRRLKGAQRPICSQWERIKVLSALRAVDHIVVFDADVPDELLSAIRPDVLVKGGTTSQIIGGEIVLKSGGRLMRTETVEHVSTTSIIERILCRTSQETEVHVDA